MAKIIIGIHGLANKPERRTQAAEWRLAIAEGLEKNCGIGAPTFNFVDVYWADLLYKYPLHRDDNYNFDSLYDSEPYIPAKIGALKRYDAGLLDSARAQLLNQFGNFLQATQKPLCLDKAADLVLAKKLKDLYFYYDPQRSILDRSGTSRRAREVLQNELQATLTTHKADDIMLIAHSMGSIIAYDVLRNMGHPDQGIRISNFVTIGSPLGLPHVKLNIDQERGYDPTIRTPSIVTKSWVNFSDKKDPVAIDTHLGDDYLPNANGIKVKDTLVINDYEAKEGINHHKLCGYLRAPEVSEHIRDFLR